MYLLFDCNNFFASCEQIFRPDWRGRPLVVLSNNDGCIIARNAEAKAAGFLMAEPYFKCKTRLEQINGVVCSANFELYRDFSERIISILEEQLPSVQQYSIDEAFAHVGEETHHNWEEEGRRCRRLIHRWTGISVSVGLAPSKTLAKLANEQAKKKHEYRGVLALRSAADWDAILQKTAVEDIWGVGKKLAPRLRGLGIRSAADLAASNLEMLRRNFGVHGERLSLELRGINCLENEVSSTRGQIIVSRSLKENILDFKTLRSVLCRFVEKAAITLRQEELLTREISITLRNSPYDTKEAYYSSSLSHKLEQPSDDTREITAVATNLLKQVWQEGRSCKKIGILLSDLIAKSDIHPSFERPIVHSSALMTTLDKLQSAGIDIHFANQSQVDPWQRSFVSPHYTTDWSQIPEAH